jgi:hypothetical protein
MDDLERQLRDDAARIKVEASPELQARLDASLHASRVTVTSPAPAITTGSLWWISSLTGLAAAAAVILFINREGAIDVDDLQHTVTTPAATEMAGDTALPEDWNVGAIKLQVENADLTRSLEQELIDLQSDLERARQTVEEDVRMAF